MQADWILKTIETKSDQLNAVDLLAGPITVTVKGVKQGAEDQPVIVSIDNGKQPYKPCKSMRRVLVGLWGADPSVWVGRKMTLYADSNVKWAGDAVGGIRISHMSDIGEHPKTLQLNETRGKKINYKIEPLKVEKASEEVRIKKAIEAIRNAVDLASLDKQMHLAEKLYSEASEDGKSALDAAYVERKEAFGVQS